MLKTYHSHPPVTVLLTAFIIFVYSNSSFCQENKNSSIKTNWEKIGPGGGGATFLPTFSYHTPNRFIIRCDMTGSYLTGNGGQSYKQLNFDNGATSFAFDPQNAQSIYVGSSVLNYSADGGKTWEQVFPKRSEIKKEYYYGDHAEYTIEPESSSLYASEFAQVKNICVDPVNSRFLCFSMGNYFFYSRDACKTFKRITVEQPISFIYTNAANAKNETYIFTASAVYVFNSLSHALKQNDLPETMMPAFSFCGGAISKTNKIIFYALHHNGENLILDQYSRTDMWMTEDMGATWKQINDPLIINNQSAKPNYTKISCAQFDAAQAYVISDLYDEKDKDGIIHYWYGALKTNDAGKEWHWVLKEGGGSGTYGIKDGADAKNLKDAWASKAFGDEFIEIEDIGVYPQNGNIAVLTDWYRAIKTTDGGSTWQQIYSTRQNDESYTSKGFDVTNTYGVHFDPFDSNHIAISYTDIGFHHSYNHGKSWIRSVSGVPQSWVNTCYWVVFDPEVKNKVWSAWAGMHDIPRGKMTRNPSWKNNFKGGICVSEDGGKTWKQSTTGMSDNSLVTSLILDEKSVPGKRILYAAAYNKGVFKSTDNGKTWQLKNNGITSNTCAFELTQAADGSLFLVVSATPNHESKNNDSLFYSGAVYKSTDAAETWQKLNITAEPFFPNGIAADPDNPNRIYLGCWAGIDLSDLLGSTAAKAKGGNKKIELKGGIFLSEDAGNSWSPAFDEQQYVYDVTVDPFHKGRVYCNTFNKAAYRSDDYGRTWKQIDGYDFHWGNRIIIDQNDREKVYITTFGSSVWHGKPVVK